jgi:hypothetical protein
MPWRLQSRRRCRKITPRESTILVVSHVLAVWAVAQCEKEAVGWIAMYMDRLVDSKVSDHGQRGKQATPC